MNRNQVTVSPKDILKAIPLFRNLDDEDLTLIASRLHKGTYPKGTVIFREGDEGDAMYLVETGQVQVVGEDQDETIARMGPGNFVGDIALLLRQPRTASLEVTIDAQLWALDKADFDDLIDTRPTIALEMMRELSRRLARTTRRKRRRSRRRITALAGHQKGVALSQAIHDQLKPDPFRSQSPVGLLCLPGTYVADEALATTDVQFLDAEDLTETTLPHLITRQMVKFKHIVLLLPDQPNPLVQKAIDLADTVVCIDEVPAWFSTLERPSETWVIEDSNADLLRTARRLTNRTIGLALSSGGARGLAHIGVLRVLEEENIPIDMIAGSSAGALFGALYAVGWSYEKILQYIQDLKSLTNFINWDFNFPVPRWTGIVKGRKARNKFLAKPLAGRTFDDLIIPMYIVAADILTGEEVVFGVDDDPSLGTLNGSVADAIRASVSIPVLPDPWHYKGHYLVDGGLVNPLPANILRERGADIIIASSVVRPLGASYTEQKDKMPHMLQTISNIFIAMEAEIIKKQIPLIDVLIQHGVSAQHTFDFAQAEDLIREGEIAAQQMLPTIKQVIESPPES